MNHAGVKSSIDSSRMFNEPYAEIPSGALGTWGCPGSPGGRVHLSPSPSICLTDSFVSLCLPLFGPGCLPAWTPVTALWGGGVHLSPFVSLHLSPVVSQPGCLARLSGWTGSFVTLCLPSFVSRCLPAWMPGTALWVDGFICLPLSPFICLARLSGLCFPSFVSRCLPAWMSGTALQADRFTCLPSFVLPLSPFICLPLSPSLDAWHGSLGGQFHLSPFVSLHLAPVVSQPGCLSRLSRRTDSLVSLGSPSFVLFPSLWVDGSSVCPLSPFVSFVSRCLPAWMPLWVDGFICLPLSPFVCLPLSPSLDALSGWTDSFVSRCLPAWMCGTHAPRFPSLPAVLSFLRGLVCLRLRPWLRSFLVLWMLGTGSSVCPSSGLRFCLGSWWVVFLVYRWLHPVCSFSASLSVAASLCPCSHLESRADESGALRCTASATRRLC